MNNLIFVAKTTGLECLKFHLESFHNDENLIVVGNPDKNLIITFLQDKKIDFYDLDNFNIEFIKNKRFDWLLNLWGGYIFKKSILDKVNHSINIHPSYLPYGRGRDPVVWAIRDQSPAGVTLHEINEDIDEGDIWYKEQISYEMPILGNELYQVVIKSCVRIFKEHWPNIKLHKYHKKPQTIAPIQTRKRKDLNIDRIVNYESLENSGKGLLLKLLAHDFGDLYSAELKIQGKRFKIRLNLQKIQE